MAINKTKLRRDYLGVDALVDSLQSVMDTASRIEQQSGGTLDFSEFQRLIKDAKGICKATIDQMDDMYDDGLF